ncbi:Detected protein of unknown function [Hibiscus syriacus]|uniref:non-specific serine/threonine protein kinase n=1 Tax=Hibiscus syriacus TaxID=106335 RepID=A0A6A3CWW5_HIBSY|nr:Detected protein of unknown function [Hibiscus syriacus]
MDSFTWEVSLYFLVQEINAESAGEGLNLLGLATASPVVRANGTDQQALLQFKAKITGDQLKIMESWNSSIHFCQWRGVTCGRKHQRVTKLELQHLELSGSLSPFIGNLSFLRELSLAGNSFYNEIPQQIGRLRRLEKLDLTNNSISGLLSNMKYLVLYNNSLRGSIPPSLGNLSSLEILALLMNGLTGTIPESLGQLANLSGFSIAGNAISGIVPVTMFNLSNIRDFDIGGNKIQGTLPSDLAINMPYIEFFSITRNQISGQIPVSISNASNLGQNYLSGPIPFDIGRLQKLQIFLTDRNIPSNLGKCQNLLRLSLSHNNLSGPIPPQVIGLSSLSIGLDLSSNFLTDELPFEVGKLKNLGVLDVSQNRLSGLLPNNLDSCVSLVKLLLNDNLFEGSIPSSLSSLRGLEALDVSDNNLSGGVPEFLVTFKALKYLNLSFNDFEGVVPSEGVFKNASATFAEGNRKLCGGIPELHLSICISKKSSNTSLRVKIAIVIVILAVTLALTCLLILRFRKKKEQPTTISVENSLLQLSYQSILRATDGFSTQNLLGSGSFGSVYKGILEGSGAAIAVKVLDLLNRGASRSFVAECEALKNIRHRNLVKVLTAISGVDYQGNDFKALVYEFMENGSLEDWLHPSVPANGPETVRHLNFFQRVSVAIDIAHAFEYLHHHCETSIIHCDLKPSNILLDKEMVGHVGDFGLVKIVSADTLNCSTNLSSSLGLRGTIGYAPPEYGMGSGLSTKGDVYSYGILLLEMFTGKRPTDERFKEGLSLRNFVETALPERVVEIIDPILLEESVQRRTIADITLNENSQRNDKHFQCLSLIMEVGLTCSADSPSERMNMSDVVTKLCSILDEFLRPTRLHRGIRTPKAAQPAGNVVFLS